MTESPQQQQLLNIGQTCSHPACSLVDFLPFKCQHCSEPFCADHYKPALHSCAKYDPTKFDRVAPACPFCQVPVAFAAGVDPNAAMEEHFATKCEVVRGGSLVGLKPKNANAAAGTSPRCARGKCNKVLIAPIRCPSCSQQFCAEHRFPAQHKCTTSATASSSSLPSSSSSRTPTPRTTTPLSSARQNAAQAAMNRAAAALNQATSSAAKSITTTASSSSKSTSTPQAAKASSTSTSTPSITNPFSKTERWGPSPPSTSPSNIDAKNPGPNPNSPTTTPTTDNDNNKPRPVIPLSFVPKSIFGMA